MKLLQGLAGVSRFWRDVILNTPSLWTFVSVQELGVQPSQLQTQLKRSCQAPLHISFQDRSYYRSNSLMDKLLATIVPTVDRWSTFFLRSPVTTVNKLIGLKFPNLTKANFHISDLENDHSPSNVTPIRFPVLEDLTIEGAISCTLHPRFKVFRLDVHSGPLPVPISSAALTSLSLVGHTRHWQLERDSLHFHCLETPSLDVSRPA